jgi:hypothetical protein
MPELRVAVAAALTLSTTLALPVSAAGPAAPGYPDAVASDPAAMGWMVGSPPPPDRMVRFEDGSYWQFPACVGPCRTSAS